MGLAPDTARIMFEVSRQYGARARLTAVLCSIENRQSEMYSAM